MKLKAQYINWISLIILWIGVAIYFINGFDLNTKFVFGVFLLVISTILTGTNYVIGTKFTFVSIILGIFSLVNYWPSPYTLSFGIASIFINIEVLILIIGIIHYFSNRKVLSVLLNKELSEDELVAEERKTINGYRESFKNKGIEELKTIANNEKLIPQAIIAAEELIEIIKNEEDSNT